MSRTKKQIADAAAQTKAVLGQHVKELISHTLDVADYNGHGHAIGKQGRHGHDMVASDAHKQSGEYIPQRMYGDSGQSSQGGFTGSGMFGGASGADYETTSVGDTPDADSAGPNGC